jgi:SAM-dependent methyltransferase
MIEFLQARSGMVIKTRLIDKFNQYRSTIFRLYLSKIYLRGAGLEIGAEDRSTIFKLYLSRKYLRGAGLEIGAMDHPLKVFYDAQVLYVDRTTAEGLRSDFPLREEGYVEVDIIDDGQHLAKIPDNSVDFVIANHVLEHYEDPIMAIKTAIRVLRRGGVLYLTVPDKRYTFDRCRNITSLEHLIRDHRAGSLVSRADHFKDAFDKKNYSLEDFEKWIAHTPMKSDYVHYHVWTDKEIVELL